MRHFLLFLALMLSASPVRARHPALELFARHCVNCHNTSDPKAGLDLSQAETALRGGDSGAVLVAGKPRDSLLLERVTDGSMPPEHDGRRLTAAEVGILRDWIAAGATWPKEKILSQFDFTTDRRAGRDWWSLQPLRRPSSPAVTPIDATAIDSFLAQKRSAAGLSLSAPADRASWIRRVSFDLLGLPPAPAEVAEYLADASPDADERLLDRLLASPHYGERWGRHWLDVVRYGESDGFEHDKYRDHAWPYRDYVIRSLNEDKTYARFVREQLAGDALSSATKESIAATGFLVAGPWDEIQNVGASPTEKLRAREEQQEELVASVAQSFLGLTVNCARCHDHKFDPVPQTDYYRLKAVFDGVDHGNRPWATLEEQTALEDQRRPLRAQLATAKKRLVELASQLPGDARLARGGDRPLVPGRFGQTFSPGEAQVAAPHSIAYEQAPLTIECWARLDARGGFNILVACNPKSSAQHWELYTYAGSGELSLYLPGCKPAEIKSGVDVCDGQWHYLAATIDKQSVGLFVDGKQVKTQEIVRGEAKATPTGPLQFGGIAEHNIGCAGLVDEVRLSRGVRTIEGLPDAPLAADGDTLGLWHFDVIAEGSFADAAKKAADKDRAAVRAEQNEVSQRIASLEQQLAQIKPPEVYAGSRRQPPATVLWQRGDITKPGSAVAPGALEAVSNVAMKWNLANDAPEAERRLRLADWITHSDNPLPWRVMANRVWQYHFGRGLVATPSDFGFSGGRPSHPELLDWLAVELRETGSLKRLHRQIMTSASYRQTSLPADSSLAQRAQAVDADNRLLWRFPVRRLEAEAVRDAMLAVSGVLNRQAGGPSFKPFTVKVFNTHFYHLNDEGQPEFQRRSIYRAAVVTGRDPLLATLDCPAPSLASPERQQTVTPLQALGLMNDAFVLRQAEALAARLKERKSWAASDRASELYRLALGREPTAEEQAEGAQLIEQHGARELAWALFNSSEFLFLR